MRILELLRKLGLKEVPVDRQRLLFNNQILQPDNSPIYWIAGIGSVSFNFAAILKFSRNFKEKY